jgi:serpin B
MKFPSLIFTLAIAGLAAQAADFKIAGEAINAFGMDLYRAQAGTEGNLLLSPYSIESALAMTCAGAAGDTRTEMQRVLHLPDDDSAVHESFKALALELAEYKARSLEWEKRSKDTGGPSTPIEFNLANRLFSQRGYPIRPAFLSLVKESYAAPVEEMDFNKAPEPSRVAINRWVEAETKSRIRDLVPRELITPATRLVLVNALYLRVPWEKQFNEGETHKERFLTRGRDGVVVPTMRDTSLLGYAKRDGYQVLTRTYYGNELQFIMVLPDSPTGLFDIERALTAKSLQECAHLEFRKVILHLPKFRIAPPTVRLGESLKKLGMKTAFDEPQGSANFDRMAPRKPGDYLAIGEVLHKTYLALDEGGTEAAAATAVVMDPGGAPRAEQPIEIRVDRPFFFAIQHVQSGACLFLGRVTDPR